MLVKGAGGFRQRCRRFHGELSARQIAPATGVIEIFPFKCRRTIAVIICNGTHAKAMWGATHTYLGPISLVVSG